MKKTRSFWIALAASFVVGGCYSPKVHQKVPLASDNADREAKLFKTHSDKAVVYFVRDMTLAGDGLTFEINANYQLIGRLSPKNYIRASASPGDYSLACDVTYMGSTKTRLTASKKLNFEAGKIYFIDVVKVDYVGCDFEFLNDTEGRNRVTAYKMAEVVTPVGRSNLSSTVENKSTATENAETVKRLIEEKEKANQPKVSEPPAAPKDRPKVVPRPMVTKEAPVKLEPSKPEPVKPAPAPNPF